MALIKCSECGHVISDRAPMCPHCGCPTRDEETQYPWDAAPSNTRVLNRRKGRSNKWLYVVIALWVAVLAGGGYYWYSQSTGDKDVKELVALFAKAVAAGDRQTISNLYPDAASADSLNFSYDEKSLQVIENNENEWKVKGVDGKEIECAVIGNSEPKASIPGQIVPCNEFYDYASKYESESKMEDFHI